MTMYATKVWGLASADWPLVTFSKQGVRNRLQSLWQPGDTMLLIGTQQKPTDIQDQGKILGYLKFTAIPVFTRDVVRPEVLAMYGDKWPYALLCTELWELKEPPVFKTFLPEIAARYPGMTLASNFAELSRKDEARILNLPSQHEILPQTERGKQAVEQTNTINFLRGGGRGPVTYTGTYMVTRTSAPAKTYLLQCASRNIMKIGWAYDPHARARNLSQPLVPEFTGDKWEVIQSQQLPDESSAYFLEQAILERIADRGITLSGEYFIPPRKLSIITSDIWVDALNATIARLEKISEEERIIQVADLLSVETELAE